MCSVYYIVHAMSFGRYIKQARERLAEAGPGYSLRKIAGVIEVEPSYLSKVERDLVSPPSEAKIVALAKCLKEDPDVLLALAGKVSSELQDIIRNRPQLFGEVIRKLKEEPEHAVLRLVREVKTGDW
jgi:transcriptional regulator with XRE-family HTH domain